MDRKWTENRQKKLKIRPKTKKIRKNEKYIRISKKKPNLEPLKRPTIKFQSTYKPTYFIDFNQTILDVQIERIGWFIPQTN